MIIIFHAEEVKITCHQHRELVSQVVRTDIPAIDVSISCQNKNENLLAAAE